MNEVLLALGALGVLTVVVHLIAARDEAAAGARPDTRLPKEMRGLDADEVAGLYTSEQIREVAVKTGLATLEKVGFRETAVSIEFDDEHPDGDLLYRAFAIRQADEVLDRSRSPDDGESDSLREAREREAFVAGYHASGGEDGIDPDVVEAEWQGWREEADRGGR